MSRALTVYRWLTRRLERFAPRLLEARVRRGREHPERFLERLGQASAPRPPGPLIWLHGVSVGETLSLLPLIERLRQKRPDVAVLVTSGTVTSAEVLARRLPAGVIHQFAPVDGPEAATRFLDHWRPSAAVFVESELWPNLIHLARERGVRLALVSARMTEGSASNWRRMKGAAREMFGAFDLILPQDRAAAERFQGLGARVDGLANLKLAGGPLTCDPAEFEALSAAIGDRPVVAAVSTHAGEEIAVVRALDALERRLFLILVPRHPERADGVAEALAGDGYRFARRSRGEAVTGETDLYLADTLGETGLFMRLADVVVLGGSFGPALGTGMVGGHNPLEPARLAKPAVSGPDVSNWKGVYDDLVGAGGVQVVPAPQDLSLVLAPLIDRPELARAMGERARRAAAQADADLDRVWAGLEPLLPPAPARGGRRR